MIQGKVARAGISMWVVAAAVTLAGVLIVDQHSTRRAAAQSQDRSAVTALKDTAQRDQAINQALGFSRSKIMPLRMQVEPAASADLIGDQLTADIVIDDEPAQIQMQSQSVRAANFRVLVHLENGEYAEVDPGLERTFRGTLVGKPGSVVAGSLLDAGLYALVQTAEGERFWIEPVAPRLNAAADAAQLDPDLHVIYSSEDVTGPGGECGTHEQSMFVPELAAMLGGEGQQGAPQGGGIAGSNSVCIAELAIDADFEYYQHYGSVQNVINRVTSIVNALNLQYVNEVGITHAISTIIVRTSAASPPYNSTNAGNLLGQVRQWWMNNHSDVQRDVVHLFSGKQFTGGPIGVAYVGSICSNQWGYAVVESDYNNNFSCATDLSAHELGHNWNAQHCSPCSNPPYTMNASAVCANTFHPTQTIPTIINYRNSRPCLQCGPPLDLNFGVSGAAAGERSGHSLALMQDITGDGIADLIVGSPLSNENGQRAGKVYVRSGANGALLWTALGEAPDDRFGFTVAASSDRVIVGAPWHDQNGTNAGAVYVFDSSGTLLKKLRGKKPGDRFGYSIAGDGDINNDGQLDFLVGAPWNDTKASNAGIVYVYRGSDYKIMKKITGQNAGDRFGFSVAMVGRANNDNHADFIIGAPYNDEGGSNAGKAYVYSGATYQLLHPAFKGNKPGNQFGRCVAGVGRVNGDGRDDFAVGAPLYKAGQVVRAGRVYVYSGATGSTLFTRTGQSFNDRLGSSIAGAGDVDADNRDDVLVGAARCSMINQNGGRAFVYSGRNADVLGQFDGDASGDLLGIAVAGYRHPGSDDRLRMALGASGHDQGFVNAGRVFVYVSGQVAGSTAPLADAVEEHAGCEADVAGNDGVVDIADVQAILSQWAACPSPCPPSCPNDVTGDCTVNTEDLLAVLTAWGTCP